VLEDVPPGTMVYGDPDHLIRLFLELLDNACKYTPPGGQITVRAVSNAAEISISIKDTGPGIPEEDLDHIFERFTGWTMPVLAIPGVPDWGWLSPTR
jgi:signal transduction histidine kinase